MPFKVLVHKCNFYCNFC